jgi:hypothetical protein
MIPVHLKHLEQIAQSRPPGYLEAIRAAGTLSPDGQRLFLDDATHAQLRAKYNPSAKIGLGDLVHRVAGPIGRAIRWPCMKGDGSNDLKPGSPCAKAREALNAIKL